MSKTGRNSLWTRTLTAANQAALLALYTTKDLVVGDRVIVTDRTELFELNDDTAPGVIGSWTRIGCLAKMHTETLTWAAAHNSQDLNSGEDIFNAQGDYIAAIIATASTGTPQIDVGDGSNTDAYVDGQALSTTPVACTLASPITTANLGVNVEVSADGGWDGDPSENFTGTVTVSILWFAIN